MRPLRAVRRLRRRRGSAVFAEVGLKHVAGLHECLVEGERCAEVVVDVAFALRGELEVVPHQFLVHRVHAVLDDGLCALQRVFAAQVGHALLGGEDLDGVFAVVNVIAEILPPFWIDGQEKMER